jgi:type IV secretory pathway VirB10-like protein
MNTSFRAHLPRLFGLAALLLASLAHAQYAWIDAKGVRHFSDRPPPPSTPADKILQAPGKPSVAELLQEPAATPAAQGSAAKPASSPTLAEREADYRKRAQQRAKEDQKQAEEAQHKQAQLENCENARRYKALLDSGVRVADTAADGGRTFISDEERARRQAQSSAVLASCR